jgi:hypothetical protein
MMVETKKAITWLILLDWIFTPDQDEEVKVVGRHKNKLITFTLNEV